LTVKRRSVRPPRPDRWSHTWPPRTAPPRSGSSRAGWWSATSATTSASPCPSPTRCWPFAHEGTAAAVEAVYTEAVGAPSAGWRPVRRRDARPLRRRPERGHGGL